MGMERKSQIVVYAAEELPKKGSHIAVKIVLFKKIASHIRTHLQDQATRLP